MARTAKNAPRPTTQALALAYGIRNTNNEAERSAFTDQLITILQVMDARTGKPDPSQRKRRVGKKGGKRRGRPPKTAE